jgi:tight adherence protein C
MTVLIVVLAFTSVALLTYSLVSMVPARPRALSRRLAELQHMGSHQDVLQRRKRQAKREKLADLMEAFGQKVAGAKVDASKVRNLLMRAGFRRQRAVGIYFGCRAFLLILFGAGTFMAMPLLNATFSRSLMAAVVVGGLGWVLPRLYVSRMVNRRKKDLQKALADALDLLVICVEAGLGLNQALVRVSEEIDNVSTIMSEELAIVNFEIRAGTPRDEALRNFGERTDLADIRSLMAMLIQTDRFGTSIAQALRVHSDTLRIKRRQRAEEAAAKTTIKLIFPLVLFVFPAMFVVILGPAVLHIAQTFSTMQ